MKAPHTYTVNGENQHPHLFIFSGVHGGENASIQVAYDLIKAFRRYKVQLKGKVSIVPAVNEVAVKTGNRIHPEDGENLNGLDYDTPKSKWTVSYQIAEWLLNQVTESDFCIDLHSGSTGEYLNHVTIQNPQLAELARHFGFAYVIFRQDRSRQSKNKRGKHLTEVINERYGIPALATEIGAGYLIDRQAVKWGVKGILSFATYVGILSSYPLRLKPTSSNRFYANGDEKIVRLPCEGRLFFFKQLADLCWKGEEVARIKNHNKEVLINAPIDGQLIYRRLKSRVEVSEIGKTAFRIIPT